MWKWRTHVNFKGRQKRGRVVSNRVENVIAPNYYWVGVEGIDCLVMLVYVHVSS